MTLALVGLFFIINQGLWKETVQTLVLVLAATAISMLAGVPLGIWAAHKPKVWKVLQQLRLSVLAPDLPRSGRLYLSREFSSSLISST